MKKRSTKAKGKSSKNEASQHKQQLEALKEKDPEFFEYLQKNDKGLLEFDLSDESGEESIEEDYDSDDDDIDDDDIDDEVENVVVDDEDDDEDDEIEDVDDSDENDL